MPPPYFAVMSGRFFSNAVNLQNIQLMMNKEHRDLDVQFGSGDLDLKTGQGFVMMGKKRQLLEALAPLQNRRITASGGSGRVFLFMNTLKPTGDLTSERAYTYVVLADSTFVDAHRPEEEKDDRPQNLKEYSLFRKLDLRDFYENDRGVMIPRRTNELTVKQVIEAVQAPPTPRKPPEKVKLDRGYQPPTPTPPPPRDDD